MKGAVNCDEVRFKITAAQAVVNAIGAASSNFGYFYITGHSSTDALKLVTPLSSNLLLCFFSSLLHHFILILI